jgi:NTE family protein
MAGALWVAGAAPERMREELEALDYRGFAFADVLGRLAKRRVVGSVVERVAPSPVDPLTWFDALLEDHGVRTWADLRLHGDDAEGLPPARQYRLVVRCLDVVHRRVVRLPWDYHLYGLDPDEQSVAEAVRASMSVPVVFEPVTLGEGDRAGLLVDGGLGTSFPASLFDRSDGRPPRHPSFAVRLRPRLRTEGWPQDSVALLRAVVETMLEADDLVQVPTCDERRTIRVDASAVVALDVRMTSQEERTLYDAGRRDVLDFLDDYDHEAWESDCR